MATWVLLLALVGGFYAFIIPGLPHIFSIVAAIVYGLLTAAAVITGAMACWIDPIDPNLRRFHQVRREGV